MNESLLNRILKDHKRRTRSLALILCLSMIVSLGTFAGFHKTAIAKVYTRKVLDCPYTHEGAEPVAHVHNDDCYEGETLVCTLPEREAHTHDDTCYAESRMLSCGLEENPGHQHSEECFDENGELICQIPEGEGAHVHTDDCYTIERALICNQPELPVHVHDAGCFRTEEITVDEPEETAASEQAVSTVPEMPVSDPDADLETADDWNREFENLELSGNWARDLVLVAATQQGRGESPNNFEAVLNDAGDAWVRHGYTRYGAWYGAPYAEWDAMFVSFCLRYAGIPAENVPNNPTAAFMAESFSMGGLFAGRDYIPAVGDLIFFDTVDDEITNIDHMGIVYHVDAENGTINTVEGDRTEAVATFGYYLNDEQIVGYGILPQNPNYVPNEEENTDNTDEAFDGFIFMTTDEEEEKQEETTTAEEATVPEVPMPAQSWERTAGGIKVSVEAPEGAFPENTRIAVTPVNGSSLKDTVSDAVNGEVLEVQAVDITFFDAEGREIEPAVPIRVVMTPAATEHAEEKTSVVHVDVAQQTAELIEQAAGTEFDNSEVVFDADAFTIYAIVYTVDFEYEVNGKLFTSSMPGAEDMPLSEIVKGLGIVGEEELETFLSKITSVTSTDEEVAVVTEDRSVRVLKDGDAQIVITMQDGAAFSIDVSAEGVTEISDENEVATVSTVNDLYLPASGEVKAELLTEEKSENAIAAVQTEAESSSYQAFSIALENVDVTAYDGFNVAVTLPEDAVVGRDFQLYQVREDGTATDLTESLTVTSEPNEDGLQNVSGISFTTEDFADFVLSYSIETFYTAVDGDTYKITLNYGPKAGIPDGAVLKVSEILPEDESYTNYLTESAAKLGVNSGDVSFARFFDIEIRKDDEKIEPQAPVQVTISLTDAPEETVQEEFKVLHFAETGLETIDGTQVEQKEDATIDLCFETNGFSVYGVVYTVDFHYEINGKTFEFCIPGGGFASLEQVVENLGIAMNDSNTEKSPKEAAKEFVADVADVQFSNPELMSVSKAENDTTVGEIKNNLGLNCEYSAELTEEEIAEINAETVEAGDWALISLKAFTSNEELTVTMKTGDTFIIQVTDEGEEIEKNGGIHIQKIIVDTNGNMINLPDNYEGNLLFKVYHSETETSDAVKDLNVGSFTTDLTGWLDSYSQMGEPTAMPADLINKTGWDEGLYINDRPYGMYYISEVSSSIPETIIDAEETEWHYKNSYILTEYPWRNHSNDNYRHVSPTYTKETEEYAAVPEVLGDHPGYSDGQTYTNDYLEFYVYNVYEAPQVEVSVSKSWNGTAPSAWEATFRLQSRLNGDTDYSDVRPVQTITLTNEETTKSFDSVPRYEKGANGQMIEIEYTVVEESYSMTDEDGTYTCDEINGYSTSDEDHHYYAIVGGETRDENGDGKLSVTATNVPKNLGKKEYIDVGLAKTWDSSFTIDNSSYATFALKRYIRTEYRDTSAADRTASPVTASVNGGNSLSVQPGVVLYLAGNFAPHEESRAITFSADRAVTMSDGTSASTITVTASGRNAECAIVRSDAFTVTQDTVFSLTDGAGNLVSGNGVFVLDTGNATSPVKDKNFSRTITLNAANGWETTLGELLSSETVYSDGNSETVYYYEYYLEETASAPAAYPSYSTGDIDNRIMTDTNVSVANGPTNRLIVKKNWRGVPDTTGFPAIRFTLYWTWADDQNGNFGGVYGNYRDIELSGNNTTWICPEELPAQMTYTDSQGNQYQKDVQYYVIEGDKNDDNSRKGSQTNGSITTSWEFYYYHNSNGFHKQVGSQGYAVAMKGSEIQQSGGTITICNKLTSYRQMDIQKQFFEMETNGSINNITANHMEHTVLGFHVIRAIRTSEGKWIDEKGNYVEEPVWMDYGDELLGGYEGSKTAVTDRGSEGFWFHDAGGDWHFRIEDNQGDKDNITAGGSGLPCYGYYLINGENIAVEYWYSFRETDVYTDLGRTPMTDWDWYSSITPVVAYGPPNSTLPVQNYQTTDEHGNPKTVSGFAAFPYAYTGQDPMRIANFRASDLIIEKEWAKDVGASEVYIKVYRSNSTGIEDVTELIAQDIINNDNWQGYVADTSVIDTENKWLVLSDANNWSTTISKLLLEPIVGGGTYQYWIEEVAYKTQNGQIKYNPDSIFDPVYQKWEHQSGDGEWQGITKGNTIQLKSKGENKLKVINTASASSSYSVTKKYDGMQSATGGQSTVSGRYPTDGSAQVVLQLQQRYRYEKTENGINYVSADNATWVEASSEGAKTAWKVDWQNAESANPSVVTLPLAKPATAAVSDEVWYNSAAAWSYKWEGLDIEKDLGQLLPDGVRVQLYYRAVEVSTPGWFDPNSTIDGTSEEGVKAVDDTTQTAAQIEAKSNEIKNVQGRTTLFLDKEWSGLGAGKTWPKGYVVEYQLVQHYHLITAENTSAGDEVNATYTPGDIFKSVDMSRANAAGTTSDMVHPQATGTLEETAYELQLTGLPRYGFLTATAADVTAAAEKGVSLTAGTVYPVVYTYSVRETAVKKDGENVGFKPQTVDAETIVDEDGKPVSSPETYEATLTNELVDVTVEKVWGGGFTPKTDESATIQLRRFKKDIEPPPTTTFTYTVSVTGSEGALSSSGTVTVMVYDSEGAEVARCVLEKDAWSHEFTLEIGGTYHAIFTANGTIFESVTPAETSNITEATNTELTATMKPVASGSVKVVVTGNPRGLWMNSLRDSNGDELSPQKAWNPNYFDGNGGETRTLDGLLPGAQYHFVIASKPTSQEGVDRIAVLSYGADVYFTATDGLTTITLDYSGSGNRTLAARAMSAPRALAASQLRAPATITWTNDRTGLPEGANPDEDEHVETVTFSGSTWSKTWTELPKYSADGKEYVYYAYETDYAGLNGATALETTYTVVDSKMTVTNTPTIPNLGNLKVTKEQLYNGALNSQASGRTFTVGLFTDATGQNAVTGISPQTITINNGTGEATFTGLTADTYYVFEIVNGSPVTTGGTQATITIDGYDYSVTYTDNPATVENGQTAEITVKNDQKPVTLDLLKVDANDNTKTLDGAEFKLHRLIYNAETKKISFEDEAGISTTTANGGKASFENLALGVYEITETKAPAGYIMTGSNTFHIKVTDSGIKMVSYAADTDPQDWVETSITGSITFTSEQEETDSSPEANALATVPNTPGTALPQTGGHGTALFTALGGLMTATAGAILTIRRKRKPAEG